MTEEGGSGFRVGGGQADLVEVPGEERAQVGEICGTRLRPFSLLAEEPVLNVSPRMHPNLAAAQRLNRQAFNRIVAAQKANEWDMEGHAQKPRNCSTRLTRN